MARHVMLNNIAHKDLRVVTRYGAEFGDNVGTVMTVPTERATSTVTPRTSSAAPDPAARG